MVKVFQLFLRAIYPALISYFIYVFASAFVEGLGLREIHNITGTASIAFFIIFLIGAIGYIAIALMKKDGPEKTQGNR